MKHIAFVFTQGPHGKASGREGLEALLATSALTDDIGVFFIADGVLLLLTQQQPEQILARNFITTFSVLPLYSINKLHLCADSASERGLTPNVNLILNVKWLSPKEWRYYLDNFDLILTF